MSIANLNLNEFLSIIRNTIAEEVAAQFRLHSQGRQRDIVPEPAAGSNEQEKQEVMSLPPTAKHPKRRTSILKQRQELNVQLEEVEEIEESKVLTTKQRRVSFRNVKTVQSYAKDNIELLDGSPTKQKINETMGSDGVLTPGRVSVASGGSMGDFSKTMSSTAHFDGPEEVPEPPTTLFANTTDYRAQDMSLNSTAAEKDSPTSADNTLQIFERASNANHSVADCDVLMDISHNNQTSSGDMDISVANSTALTMNSTVNDTITMFGGAQNQGRAPADVSQRMREKDSVMNDDTMMMFRPPQHGFMNVSSYSTRSVMADLSGRATMNNTLTDADGTMNEDTMMMFGAGKKPSKVDTSLIAQHQAAPEGDNTINDTMMMFQANGANTSVGNAERTILGGDMSMDEGNCTAARGLILQGGKKMSDIPERTENTDMSVDAVEMSLCSPAADMSISNSRVRHVPAPGSAVKTSARLGGTMVVSSDNSQRSPVNKSRDFSMRERQSDASTAPQSSNSSRMEVSGRETFTESLHHSRGSLESPMAVDKKRSRLSEVQAVEERRRMSVMSNMNMSAFQNDEQVLGYQVGKAAPSDTFTRALDEDEPMVLSTVTSDYQLSVSSRTITNGNATLCTSIPLRPDNISSRSRSTSFAFRSSVTQINSSLLDSISFNARDISMTQSPSLADSMSEHSTTEEQITSYLRSKLFDPRSLNIMYSLPLPDQDEANHLRSVAADKLQQIINETTERCNVKLAKSVEALANQPDRVKALETMNGKKLNAEDRDVMLAGREAAEADWLVARHKVAAEVCNKAQEETMLMTEERQNLEHDVVLSENLEQLEQRLSNLRSFIDENVDEDRVAQLVAEESEQEQVNWDLEDELEEIEIQRLRAKKERREGEMAELRGLETMLMDCLAEKNANQRRVLEEVQHIKSDLDMP